MNRIIIIPLFMLTVVLTACGQYGDLYAPSDSVEQQVVITAEEEKDSSQSVSEQSVSEQSVSAQDVSEQDVSEQDVSEQDNRAGQTK